jgi:hypothetical protein
LILGGFSYPDKTEIVFDLFTRRTLQMKSLKYLALLSTLALLTPLGAFARDKNQHSVSFPDPVQVGSAQLQPGTYKVKWDGSGPEVQVSFVRDGKTVATVPGTLKTKDTAVVQDDIVVEPVSGSGKALREIDFGHQQEALVFGQSGM